MPTAYDPKGHGIVCFCPWGHMPPAHRTDGIASAPIRGHGTRHRRAHAAKGCTVRHTMTKRTQYKAILICNECRGDTARHDAGKYSHK